MNWLDRAVGLVAPGAAMRRARDRKVAELISGINAERESTRWLQRAGGYAGAQQGRRFGDWFAPNSDAAAAIVAALPFLRNRSRDLVRNNHHASAAMRVWETSLVGTGIRPQLPGKTPVEDLWRRFERVTDYEGNGSGGFYALQSMAARAMVEGGEALIRRVRVEPTARNPFGVVLQGLEGDFIDTSLQRSGGGVRIEDGIEYGNGGRPVALWLRQGHPGTKNLYGVLGKPVLSDSFRVPMEDVIHLFPRWRFGQTRGVPWLSPVIVKLMDLNDYTEAEIVRCKIAACFTVFVTGSGGLLTDDATGAGLGEESAALERVSPGLVKYLETGQDVKVANPSGPTTTYEMFMRAGARDISAGVGLPYELITNDLGEVNFSSFRAGMNQFKADVRKLQGLTLIPQMCKRVWGWFLEAVDEHALAGTRTVQRSAEVEWALPRFESIEPLKDAQAALLLARMGRKPVSRLIREDGEDPDAIHQEYEADYKKWDESEAGMVFDSDPRKTSRAGAKDLVEEDDGEGEGEGPPQGGNPRPRPNGAAANGASGG